MDDLDILYTQAGPENPVFLRERLDIGIEYPQFFNPLKVIDTLKYDPNLFEIERLATAVHYAEDIFVAAYYQAWWDYFNASQGFELAVPPAEIYQGTVPRNESKTYGYLFDIMTNPMLYEGIPENERILAMSLKELQEYIKSAQMGLEEKLLLEAIWGAERSILAYRPHIRGIRLSEDEEKIRLTIQALSDLNFMIFCRQLPEVPGIKNYLEAQHYFTEKIKRVRNRYSIYTKHGLIRYKDVD